MLVYNLKMMDVIILTCFFIIFCVFVWLEYSRFKFKRRKLEEAKEHGLKAIEDYEKLNYTEAAKVGKEMVQRIKERELKAAILDAEQQENNASENGR